LTADADLVRLGDLSLARDYKRQFGWRDWASVFAALPPLDGHTVLDLGCGAGDQAAELVARGARVIGVDTNDEFLADARARGLPNTDFRLGDLRAPLDIDEPMDGLWCSFTAAFFPDLQAALARWTTHLRPGGWIALTEIDDLFGHVPVQPRTKALFDAYADEARAAGRYDFHMGRKLRGHLERASFAVSQVITLADRELAFDGPAEPDVLKAWRNRLDRMKLLREFCGDEFEFLRDDFLSCLIRDTHRSTARVICCIGHSAAALA
jgi:SAM-dependent methyltransferase